MLRTCSLHVNYLPTKSLSTYPLDVEVLLDHLPLVHAVLDLDVLGHVLHDDPVHPLYLRIQRQVVMELK